MVIMHTDLNARMSAPLDGSTYDWTISPDAMRWTPNATINRVRR